MLFFRCYSKDVVFDAIGMKLFLDAVGKDAVLDGVEKDAPV